MHLSCKLFIKQRSPLYSDTMSLYLCVPVANPAGRTKVVGHTGPAAMGVQPPHEHSGSVRASTGGLGGGENGSLPPHLRAGNTSLFSAKH